MIEALDRIRLLRVQSVRVVNLIARLHICNILAAFGAYHAVVSRCAAVRSTHHCLCYCLVLACPWLVVPTLRCLPLARKLHLEIVPHRSRRIHMLHGEWLLIENFLAGLDVEMSLRTFKSPPRL